MVQDGCSPAYYPHQTFSAVRLLFFVPSAQAAFRRLGFVPEALLADYVEDRNGVSRDLVIMSYDVDGLTGQMDEPLSV